MIWKMFDSSAEKLRVVAGVVNRKMKIGAIDLYDLHQIGLAEDVWCLGDVLLLVDAEFCGQHAPTDRIEILADLQTHDIGKFPVTQCRLYHHEQVVGLLFHPVGNRISCYSEILTAVNLQSGKEYLEVIGYQFLERSDRGAVFQLLKNVERRHRVEF